jgi:hypothetical protein
LSGAPGLHFRKAAAPAMCWSNIDRTTIAVVQGETDGKL